MPTVLMLGTFNVQACSHNNFVALFFGQNIFYKFGRDPLTSVSIHRICQFLTCMRYCSSLAMYKALSSTLNIGISAVDCWSLFWENNILAG